jgi:hypothetical protein
MAGQLKARRESEYCPAIERRCKRELEVRAWWWLTRLLLSGVAAGYHNRDVKDLRLADTPGKKIKQH